MRITTAVVSITISLVFLSSEVASAASHCATNGLVCLTNVVCAFSTNTGWTVTFDLVGGTNGLRYDIFATTNRLDTNTANSQWWWLGCGPTCRTYQYT